MLVPEARGFDNTSEVMEGVVAEVARHVRSKLLSPPSDSCTERPERISEQAGREERWGG